MIDRISHLKIALAFVAATFAALLVVPFGHCLALGVGLASRGTCAGTLVGYLAIGSVIAFPAVAVFGVPLYLIFRRLGWLAWWQVLLGASLAGMLAAAVLHLLDGATSFLGSLALFGGLGATAGIAFWYFGLRRRKP